MPTLAVSAFFFFNDTATTEIYTLSLHDALPIYPRALIKIGRTAGGIVALAGAAFLGVRGQVLLAVPLGVTGLSLLGLQEWLPPGIRSYAWPFGQKSSGQVSRVRSNFVEVTLEHDTGAMTGT